MMKNTMDVLIIGGGVVGLNCAWRLAQKGAYVTLVERRECGGGSSNAALGALWPSDATKHNPLQTLQRQSLWKFEAFAEEVREDSGVDILFQRSGRLENILSEKHFAHSQQEMLAANEEWPQFGDGSPTFQIIDTQTAHELEPLTQFGEYGAIQCQATAQLSTERMVQALKRAARNTGVIIREHEELYKIKVKKRKVVSIRTNQNSYHPEIVLICAGAWSSILHPFLKQYAPVMPLKGQALLLELSKPILQRVVKNDSIYLIQRENNQVILGATTELDAGYDEEITDAAREQLLQQAAQFVPAVREAKVLQQWAGLRPAPNYRKPIMGPLPNVEGLWAATGHGKIGIGISPLIGTLMAEWLTEGQPSQDLSTFLPQLR